jgi:CPA2 family monovalent cation:H+ antiporter-2
MSPSIPELQGNCTHLDRVRDFTPEKRACQECLDLGDTWVHLRICMICGQVGCCDDSKNKHATRHYRASGHPIVASLEPGENWMWCYEDRVLIEP